ncbi:MAG: HEAT repeat domain-containing protein [Cyanobacteria bacterium P01_F01_bin.53]
MSSAESFSPSPPVTPSAFSGTASEANDSEVDAKVKKVKSTDQNSIPTVLKAEEEQPSEKQRTGRRLNPKASQSSPSNNSTLNNTAATDPFSTIEESAVEKGAIEEMVAQLSQGDFHSKWDSAKRFSKQFAEWGDRIVPHLINQLESTSNPEDQWFLVRILSQFDTPEVVAAIAHILTTTPDEDLQVEATKALTMLGTSAIAALTAQLESNASQQQRILAARTLSHIRRSGTIEPLLSLATDSVPELRAIAIEALGSFHDARITPVLLAGLSDEPAMCIEAIRTLGRRRDLLATTDLIGPLSQCLQAPSKGNAQEQETIAKESAIALGRLGTEAATQALGNILTQPVSTKAKVAAVRALGWMNTPTAVDYLVQAFDCKVPVVMPSVKEEIVRAIAQTQAAELKEPAATPLIAWLQATAALHDPAASQTSHTPETSLAADPETLTLKQTIISALARLGVTDALDSLIPLLSDPDSRIRMHVLSALKQIDPRAAQSKVQKYLDDTNISPQHRQQAAESLAAW